MSPFKDFNDLVEPLILPINGKDYTIPPVTIANGMRYRLALEEQVTLADEDLYRIFLGPALDQMIADDVPEAARLRAFFTANADFLRGRKVAEMIWETGGDPKAVNRWLETTQETAPPNGSPAPDAESTTKRPASTSTTKTSRQKRKPKATPSN